ncbi:MAG: hypothetical protein JNL89_15255 [Rhodanobacteraceae bacterium]|nr:hypothetical protein [Rhodanobacteraceae bacterium]
MRKTPRRRRRWLWLPFVGLGSLYLVQLPFRAAGAPAAFELIAHRGVHQTFHSEGLTNETCTAERIDPPRHAYLENTLPSMQAAFDAGADMIEIDVHRTADGEIAVFHDWRVECRTEGEGETRAHTLAQLKALDVGHGYTADGGRTFPFRGHGVGLLPSLREVLRTFPQERFMLDQKDRSQATTDTLIAVLQAEGALGRTCLSGTLEQNAAFRATIGAQACTIPGRDGIKRCLLDYVKTGWTGALPASCAGQRLTLPDWTSMYLLWGWPGTFIERMRASGGSVHIYTNDPARLPALRAMGVDGILTDRIELMTP